RKIQHLRDQRQRLVELHSGQFQRALQALDVLLIAFAALQTQTLLEYLHNRVEGRTLEEWLPGAFHPEMGMVLDEPAELFHQARLAYARLSNHEYELSLAVASGLPTAQRKTDLVLA